jgi:hypothetical protein
MWTWNRLPGDSSGAMTFAMEVPGGHIVRTVHPARQGRGPDFPAHPIPASEAMVYVPTGQLIGGEKPPCE